MLRAKLTAAEARENSKRARIPNYEKMLSEILDQVVTASSLGLNVLTVASVLPPEMTAELRSLGYGVYARNHETTITW